MGLGRLLCRSEKSMEQRMTSRSYMDRRETGAFPVVRIVSDNEGSLVTQNRSEVSEKMLFPEAEAFVPSNGPQSIYAYEYTTGMPMDICYNEFGDDPVDLLRVRQYNIPRAIYGGSKETIVKVEVRQLENHLVVTT